MSTITDAQSTVDTKARYQGRLRNTLLLALLPVSVILILLMGGISYLRSRSVIEGQVHTQLDTNLELLASDFDQWTKTKSIRMDIAVRKPVFQSGLDRIISSVSAGEAIAVPRQIILAELDAIASRGEELLFTSFFITSPDGQIIASSRQVWEKTNISDTDYFQDLSSQSASMVVNNPSHLIDNDTVVITSIPIFDSQNSLKATVFGLSGSLSMIGFLEEAIRFNPEARSYIITDDDQFIWIDPYRMLLTGQQPSDDQTSQLLPLKDTYVFGASEDHFHNASIDTFDGSTAIASYTWLPSLRGGLVLELPQEVAFGELNTLGFITLGIAGLLGALVAGVIVVVTQRLVGPLRSLTQTTELFSQGIWDQRAPDTRNDEIGLLSHTFNVMAEDLSEIYQTLESQVQERTESLEKRSQLLEASAEVSQRASTEIDPEILIQEVVGLIQEQFDLYYVGLFLVDDDMEWAILQAGTGQAGREMVSSEHKIRIGEGMIGWCILNAQTRIALDVGEDATRFENPYLPETRSEGALPLRSRGHVIGALTVQSSVAEAFDEDTIKVFQTMADQIASALDNVRLLTRAQTSLESERRAYRDLSQQAWKELLKSRPDLGVLASSKKEIQFVQDEWTLDMKRAGKNQEIIHSDPRTINIPVVLRDQVLGVVRLRKDEDENNWTDSEIQLVDSLIDQLEGALESARLYSETQRSAARERLVSEIATKIRSTTDPQEMLQTAVTELQDAFQAKRVQVLMPSKGEEPSSQNNDK